MFSQTSIGVDLQDHAIRMVCLKRSLVGTGATLLAQAVYPIEDFQTIEERLERISGLVNDFLSENSLTPTSVFLSIPRDKVIVRYLDLPSAVRENLKQSVGYQLEKYIPFPSGDICYDCQVVKQHRESDSLQVFLAAIKESEIDAYLSISTGLSISFSGIEPRSSAAANFFSSPLGFGEKEPFGIMFIGESFLELGIVESGFLSYTRRVSRGNETINLAEQVGREWRKAVQIVGDREAGLKIAVIGGESDAQLMTSVKEMLDGVKSLEISEPDLQETGIPSSSLIPAYGAALKGISQVPMDINLIPDARRKRPSKRGKYMISILGGMLILSVLAGFGGEVYQDRVYLNRLNAELAQLRVRFSKIQNLQKQLDGIEKHVEILNNFYGKDTSAIQILKELTTRIPKTAWVQRLDVSDGKIRIDGLASSSTELISLLDESNIFKNVAFVSSISRDRQGNERFRIKLDID